MEIEESEEFLAELDLRLLRVGGRIYTVEEIRAAIPGWIEEGCRRA